MHEITFEVAIEIAKHRRDNMNGTPLLVLFNGDKGDFNSLRNLGIIGQLEEDENGDWRISTGYVYTYLHPSCTVWVG